MAVSSIINSNGEDQETKVAQGLERLVESQLMSSDGVLSDTMSASETSIIVKMAKSGVAGYSELGTLESQGVRKSVRVSTRGE